MSEDALKPAEQNPWYLLATVYGCYEPSWADPDLFQKNQRIWNAVTMQNLPAQRAHQISGEMGISLSNIGSLTARETTLLEKRFERKILDILVRLN